MKKSLAMFALMAIFVLFNGAKLATAQEKASIHRFEYAMIKWDGPDRIQYVLPDRFELARMGRHDEARRLYEWFLPLLRLDVVPKFVQLIKLVQEELGQGPARVRPPRLELAGAERDAALALIRERLAKRAIEA